jgi:hypothetical protein
MTTNEENALRIQVEKLQKQNLEMRKLSTIKGFYEEYFKALKTVKFNYEAFDLINEKYFHLFGQYRYSDFKSFKVMTNYYNKKQ